MGANSKEFMSLRMAENDYKKLPQEHRDKIEIRHIEPDDFDYSFDEVWMGLRSDSSKAFKKQKAREFELRNNKTK